MLEDVKLLLGITGDDKDKLLELLIKMATQTAQKLTGVSNTAKLQTCIVKMVCYDYNRLGTEGLNSESYSGVSFNYSGDYPDYLLRELNAVKASGNGAIGIFW